MMAYLHDFVSALEEMSSCFFLALCCYLQMFLAVTDGNELRKMVFCLMVKGLLKSRHGLALERLAVGAL